MEEIPELTWFKQIESYYSGEESQGSDEIKEGMPYFLVHLLAARSGCQKRYPNLRTMQSITSAADWHELKFPEVEKISLWIHLEVDVFPNITATLYICPIRGKKIFGFIYQGEKGLSKALAAGNFFRSGGRPDIKKLREFVKKTGGKEKKEEE